jgi:small subunit ribosomal protein S16
MLMLRLQRVGRKNHAEFRVVVTEKTRGPKSANYLEIVGHYSPHTNVATVDEARITHWIGMGAQVSDTLHNILVTNKVLKGKKKNVLPKKTPIVKEVAATPAAETTATPEAGEGAAEVVVAEEIQPAEAEPTKA